jgi:arylsulfatase A-like enzyme
VILIGIDTIRADRASLLSANERGRDLTPNLRRLAERGTVFTNAIAQSSWTLPSFASMLTGMYPEQHGAEHLTSTLAPAQVTLAELLREAGYHTMSVVSCEYLNAASGMGQGFEVLDDSQVRGHRAVTSREITDRAISQLESNGARPLFLFAHYFDPHFCYRDHQEFDFGDWYQGRLRDAVQNADQNAFCWLIGAIGPTFADRSRATDEDRRFLRDAYDEEVAFTDAQLGRLLDYIERRRLWDSTMVIAVGDHGEELLERNYSGHSTTLYREQIDVPLVIAAPGVRHSVDPEPAEARAIFPTICDFLNVPARANATPANSLLAERDTGALGRSSTRPVAEPPRPGEFVPKYVWLTCATDGRWKLIKDHLRDRAALYDLRSDPGETRDCSADNQEQRRKLENALDELDARVELDRKTAGRTEADQEQKRRLKSLGYL